MSNQIRDDTHPIITKKSFNVNYTINGSKNNILFTSVCTQFNKYILLPVPLGSIKVFNQNVDAETAEEIVTMAYDCGKISRRKSYFHHFLSSIIDCDLQYNNVSNVYAYILGINYFDICDPCGTDRAEQEIGKIVRKKGWNRRSYVISTRVYWHR